MKGLVYKDFSLFFKSVDKKSLFLAAGMTVLLFFEAGEYGGFFAAVMLAMVVGMQNILCFASDEKVNWKKFQLAMPVSSSYAVGSKYLSVLLTLCFSVGCSITFYLTSSVIYRNFDSNILFLSIAIAIVIPIFWTALCLPLTYWFGFRSAQTMGVIAVIPFFYLIKYFEDGPGLTSLPGTLSSYLAIGFITALIAFVLSYFLSVLGYKHKNHHFKNIKKSLHFFPK